VKKLLLVVALAVAGCSNDPNSGPVQPQPVTGQVLYDGRPAAGVEVTLLPTDAPMVPRIPRNPHGVTGADGRFSLTTFAEGDGAAEGGYQVLLKWPPTEKSEAEEATEYDRLLGWYDGTHSKVSVRVKPGSNDIPVIAIPAISRPPQPSQGVPGRN
jgi:hypothetical protein